MQRVYISVLLSVVHRESGRPSVITLAISECLAFLRVLNTSTDSFGTSHLPWVLMFPFGR